MLLQDSITSADSLEPFFLRVRIVPSARVTKVIGKMDDGETWKIYIHAPPENGKANQELARFLRKEYRLLTKVLSGKTHRTKLLKCTPLPCSQ